MIHILVICNNPYPILVNKLEKIVRSVTNNQTDLIHMHFITDNFNVIRYSETNNNVHYVKNIRICVSEFLIGEDAIMTRQLVKSDNGKYDFVFYNQCPIPANTNMGTFFGPVKSPETMRSYLPKLLKPRGYVIFAALGDRRVNDDIQALKDTREDMIRRHNNTHIFETLRSMGMKYIELSGVEVLAYKRQPVKMFRSRRTARRSSSRPRSRSRRSRSFKSAPSMFLPYSI
jgi:hypothetical protein